MKNQSSMERLLSKEITVKEQIIITPYEKRGDMLHEELDKHTVAYLYQLTSKILCKLFLLL